MRVFEGPLRKMTACHESPVSYFLSVDSQTLALNPLIGRHIQIAASGAIFCVQCGRNTKKSFQQGFCYPCYQRLLECDLCVIHPERCHSERQACPQDDWAHSHCHASHVVYLSNTSALKVGVTRVENMPSRWIDQGAIQAQALCRVSNRYRAGVIEVALKKSVYDKTNWRAMLKNTVAPLDFRAVVADFIARTRADILSAADGFLHDLEWLDPVVVTLDYPVMVYPHKVVSCSLDKTPQISGQLQGIKGQYLILDTGVMNVRKFSGYEVAINVL